MNFYQIDSNKVAKDGLRMLRESDTDVSNVVSLVTAPMVLIEHRGMYWLTTKNLTPREVEDNKYKFTEKTAGVIIPLHIMFVGDDEQLKISQLPQAKFVTTVEEILNDYSFPIPTSSWFEDPEIYKSWILALTPF